jgi:hypothetical protein
MGLVTGRRPSKTETSEVADGLRRLLEALPAEMDTPIDASIRRRLEGAVIALDVAAGEPLTPAEQAYDGRESRRLPGPDSK